MADIVQRADMRMIQAGEGAGLMLETLACGIAIEMRSQDLNRDRTVEPCIAGAIHLAHAAGPDGRNNLVRTKARPSGEGRPRFLATRELTEAGLPRRILKQPIAFLLVSKQGLHLAPQFFVRALVKKRHPLTRLALQRIVVELLDLAPAVRMHASRSCPVRAPATPWPVSNLAARFAAKSSERRWSPQRLARRKSAVPQRGPFGHPASPAP